LPTAGSQQEHNNQQDKNNQTTRFHDDSPLF
jgi:hypothetical protein